VGERPRALEGLVNRDAWRGCRVLVTGHTGFKGAWLALWLKALGARVEGLSLEAPTTPSLHALLGGTVDPIDIRDRAAVEERVRSVEPEVVFHLAAQSLVRPAFADPVGTYEVNVCGTANVLEAARRAPSTKAVVVVTSDKVYAPHPDGRPHDEDSPLGGVEPYSSSKAGAELVAAAYRHGYLDGRVATARAGNVIGGGDWAVDRIVPDVLHALERGEPVALRHPEAVRPWQHVLDPLHGYLLLAERLLDESCQAPAALNFGPEPDESCSVASLVERLSGGFGGPGWRRDEDAQAVPETGELRLDASRARAELGWVSALGLDDVVSWTVDWHKKHAQGDDVRVLTLGQIAAYEERL
jgi:CDP-glucose 4,6-dehydratase